MQAVVNHRKISVIHPQGVVNAANALEFERDMTTALVQDGCSMLLVNLEQVESMDSAGLMALVSVLKLAQDMRRGFSLCCVSPSLRIILELTQLDRVFKIHEREEAFDGASLSLKEAKLVYA
jgi:anti-sigma B factor antagonist